MEFFQMGFESHPGLRFFLCPLMVDSLHLPLFPEFRSIANNYKLKVRKVAKT